MSHKDRLFVRPFTQRFPVLHPGDLITHLVQAPFDKDRFYLILSEGTLHKEKTESFQVEVYHYEVLNLTRNLKHCVELSPTSNWEVYHQISSSVKI